MNVFEINLGIINCPFHYNSVLRKEKEKKVKSVAYCINILNQAEIAKKNGDYLA